MYLISKSVATYYESKHITKAAATKAAKALAAKTGNAVNVYDAPAGDTEGYRATFLKQVEPARNTNTGDTMAKITSVELGKAKSGGGYAIRVKAGSKIEDYFDGYSYRVDAMSFAKELANKYAVPLKLTARERNSGISSGEWQACHAYRKLSDGTVQVLTEADGAREANTGKSKRIPNVAQGFFANGVFHPIRSSWDYDSARGDGGRVAKGKKKPAKKAAKKRASVTKTKRVAMKIPAPRSMARKYYE